MTTFSEPIRRHAGFFVCALALGIAPGPDNLFVLTQSLSQGAAAGVLVTLGLCTGLCFHVSLAAFGIAAILKRYPKAFGAITLLGACYLLYLAWLTWRGAGAGPAESEAVHLPAARLYLRGIIMNVCNPKVMLFFLALMPRFTRPEKGHVAAQLLLLGLLFAIATIIVFCGIALLGGSISGYLARSPSSYAVLQYVSAGVMVLLAVWIVARTLQTSGSTPE